MTRRDNGAGPSRGRRRPARTRGRRFDTPPAGHALSVQGRHSSSHDDPRPARAGAVRLPDRGADRDDVDPGRHRQPEGHADRAAARGLPDVVLPVAGISLAGLWRSVLAAVAAHRDRQRVLSRAVASGRRSVRVAAVPHRHVRPPLVQHGVDRALHAADMGFRARLEHDIQEPYGGRSTRLARVHRDHTSRLACLRRRSDHHHLHAVLLTAGHPVARQRPRTLRLAVGGFGTVTRRRLRDRRPHHPGAADAAGHRLGCHLDPGEGPRRVRGDLHPRTAYRLQRPGDLAVPEHLDPGQRRRGRHRRRHHRDRFALPVGGRPLPQGGEALCHHRGQGDRSTGPGCSAECGFRLPRSADSRSVSV